MRVTLPKQFRKMQTRPQKKKSLEYDNNHSRQKINKLFRLYLKVASIRALDFVRIIHTFKN